MTYVFALFAAEDAAIYMPGAPFLLSAALMFICLFAIIPGRQTVES